MVVYFLLGARFCRLLDGSSVWAGSACDADRAARLFDAGAGLAAAAFDAGVVGATFASDGVLGAGVALVALADFAGVEETGETTAAAAGAVVLADALSGGVALGVDAALVALAAFAGVDLGAATGVGAGAGAPWE